MKAIGNKVIIELDTVEEKTKAGIYIPENNSKPSVVGTVVAAGPGEHNSPMQVSVGDKVAIRNNAGTKITNDEKEYTVVSQLDILAVF